MTTYETFAVVAQFSFARCCHDRDYYHYHPR